MAKRIGLTVTQDNTQSFLKRVFGLSKYDVLVGIPADHTGRLDDAELKAAKATARKLKLNPAETTAHIIRLGNVKNNSPSNALIGYVQEFGSQTHGIPPRPFLIPGVRSLQAEAVKMLAQAGRFEAEGKHDKAMQVLNALGLKAQARVRMKITEGAGWPPLSQRTLAQRRARGRRGTHPLIDTGQLRNAVSYVVRKR